MIGAYTYLIKWSSTNVKYYGVRYANGCSPSDLWTTYFTSSKEVMKYREIHGDPDIISIRRCFSNKRDALLWENKVIARINAVARDDYLNKTNLLNKNSEIRRGYKCKKHRKNKKRRAI